eukprot:4153943-Karenia_brevis.AAC.1
MNIACGNTPLLTQDMRPLFERLTRKLFEIYSYEWKPPFDEDDPVQWKRRDQNKLADYLCNYSMDNQRSFVKCWMRPDAVDYDSANVLVFSDGGCRGANAAASAWIMLWAVRASNTWEYHPMAVKADFWKDCNINSFKAEALALESAILYMCKYARTRGQDS